MSEIFKALPTNITKDHLLQAIAKIDEEGIPKNSDSNFYDVVFNDKKYPPKVIVSFANLFANGEIIDRSTFPGGLNTPCFNLLESNGFILTRKIKKNETTMIPEQVMVYEVKSGKDSQDNAAILQNETLNFFYWNHDKFKKLNIDDFVFIINVTTREVLFTKMDKAGIKIKTTPIGKTSFTDERKTFIVSGKYDQFIRLKVLLKIEAPKEWKWKTLGSSETTYLSGKNIDLVKAENLVLNIMQLMELSDDQKYQEVLLSCLSNFQTTNYSLPDLINSFTNAASQQNLIFSSYLTKRYIASLATKPFVIFTGLSGSGKTKLAQTFAKWICEDETQYKIIPVGADWTNREPLLGYPNSLETNKYVLPDNGALDLIIAAINNAKDKQLKDCKPYFLILDEMNLSHVERYFADFLSGMESKEDISLYTGNKRKDENGRPIPKEIKLPPNLFMVGTVNIDETTYMFSPKVLDRANTIEFRVDKNDLMAFFDSPNEEPTDVIDGTGSAYSNEFMKLVAQKTPTNTNYQEQLLGFFKALQPIGAEFGYRTANEMNRLVALLVELGMETNEHALDVAVMQKLLPKLHGSRTKLNKALPILASFCFKDVSLELAKNYLEEVKREGQLISDTKPHLPLSFAKIARMYAAAQENGFASYAEG